VLRSHRAPKDRQDLLGESARAAREALEHTPAPSEPSSTTPVADIEHGSPVTLGRIQQPPAETPVPPAPRERATRETASADPGAKKGLLHKIPLFLRRFAGMDDD
jgi:hypothetical protein